MEALPPGETKQERIRRVSREWYWRNRDRIRQKKLEQCHGYRRRLRAGRPPKSQNTIFFNTDTGEMIDSKERFAAESEVPVLTEPPAKHIRRRRTQKPQIKREDVPTAKIEPGKFFVSFI